jgi:predicted metal-dependent HD superfamily phosphohydrolase
MWVVRHLHELCANPSPEAVAAALYHDAVYDPRSSANEADSAALARRALGDAGWNDERCNRVAEMIMATADHLAGDGETAALVDADLAILGAEPSAYAAYVNGVRREYAHVDDDSWRVGRADVLRRFLRRDRIFHTEAMFERRERRARANLHAELAALDPPS